MFEEPDFPWMDEMEVEPADNIFSQDWEHDDLERSLQMTSKTQDCEASPGQDRKLTKRPSNINISSHQKNAIQLIKKVYAKRLKL